MHHPVCSHTLTDLHFLNFFCLQPQLNPENPFPILRVEVGLVLSNRVWMNLWEFCLIKNTGLGFGRRIEHISLMAIIHSRNKFQALKIKISHLLVFIGVRKLSSLRS